jgi:hypothetical protein
MSETTITCELVDQRDLDTRYLAGRLDEAEAEAFEAHYFGCDRCWGLVRQGQAVKAALAPPVVSAPRALPATRRSTPWLALAASLAVLAGGLQLWRVIGGRQRPEDTVRGPSDSLQLVVEFRGDTLLASWSRLPGATTYRTRFYSEDGVVLLERESAETSLVLPPGAQGRLVRETSLLMQVQALDDLRQLRGRSGQRPIARPPKI